MSDLHVMQDEWKDKNCRRIATIIQFSLFAIGTSAVIWGVLKTGWIMYGPSYSVAYLSLIGILILERMAGLRFPKRLTVPLSVLPVFPVLELIISKPLPVYTSLHLWDVWLFIGLSAFAVGSSFISVIYESRASSVMALVASAYLVLIGIRIFLSKGGYTGFWLAEVA